MAGCNSSSNNNATSTTINDTSQQAIAPSRQIPQITDSTNISPLSDSIDRANASTINSAKGNVNKATVSLKDSLLSISSSKFQDHRFFGYSQPDTLSKRMLLFSSFTNDVEGNPFHCPYGAYYSTTDMDSMQLKYVADNGSFAKFTLLQHNAPQEPVYIEKKWIDFEK